MYSRVKEYIYVLPSQGVHLCTPQSRSTFMYSRVKGVHLCTPESRSTFMYSRVKGVHLCTPESKEYIYVLPSQRSTFMYSQIKEYINVLPCTITFLYSQVLSNALFSTSNKLHSSLTHMWLGFLCFKHLNKWNICFCTFWLDYIRIQWSAYQ